MKNLFLIAVIVLGFSGVSFAQVGTQSNASVTASATTQIISPIGITNPTPMAFGAIAKSAAAGTVVLSVAGDRTSALGASLGINTGVTAASFSVTGEGLTAYTIKLPLDDVVTLTGPGAPMKLNGFNRTDAGVLLENGTQSFSVGATLSVNAAQAVGQYTGNYTVTVAYN